MVYLNLSLRSEPWHQEAEHGRTRMRHVNGARQQQCSWTDQNHGIIPPTFSLCHKYPSGAPLVHLRPFVKTPSPRVSTSSNPMCRKPMASNQVEQPSGFIIHDAAFPMLLLLQQAGLGLRGIPI
ncbi:hypothetical protein NEOLEDRAFT_1139001, partial [Neolentinus lepideus HHB14362 ss-1]